MANRFQSSNVHNQCCRYSTTQHPCDGELGLFAHSQFLQKCEPFCSFLLPEQNQSQKLGRVRNSRPLHPLAAAPHPHASRSAAFRQEFVSDQCPDLTREVYLQDIHCVGSLCKLYFRELPNPLLTYELYEKFTVSGRGGADLLSLASRW